MGKTTCVLSAIQGSTRLEIKRGIGGTMLTAQAFFMPPMTTRKDRGVCPRYSPGAANWTIRHNTIASLGNTEAFPWQSTVTTFQNIVMINNYLSGFDDP